MKAVAWGRVSLFVTLVFALDWALAAASYAAGVRYGTTRFVALGTLYMGVPLLVAAVLHAAWREPVLERLGLRPVFNAILPIAVVLGVTVCVGAAVFTLLMPGVGYSPEALGVVEKAAALFPPEDVEKLRATMASTNGPTKFVFGLLQAVAAGCTVNAVVALGEEAGWRGYLQRALSPLGFWKASALVGVIWGLWHAPLILQGHNYPQHPELGVVLMTVFTVLLSAPLAWLQVQAGSSWAPSLAHGIINGGAGLAILLAQGGDDLTTGVTGLPGMLVLVLVNVLIWRTGSPEPPAAVTQGNPNAAGH